MAEDLTVAMNGKLIGRLHAERLKRIAVLRDRLLIWSSTPSGHCCGRDAIHRQETGIGIEAQRKKQHDESTGENRKGAMRLSLHQVSLSILRSHVNDCAVVRLTDEVILLSKF